MKRLAGLSALALIISSTSGCGWLWGENGYFRDRGSDYLEARQTAPMKLPADVDAKRLDPLLPVPAQVPNDTQTSGEFEVPRPQAMQVRSDERDFSLQRSGDSRWIVAQRVPAEVWPLARQFFEDNGFRIADERPQVGEFTTAWQRFDELSANMARRLSSRVSGVAADAETRVRVRIEPGVQRNTSEVFVTSVQRPAGSTADVAFAASGNASLEGALLDEMMVSMARSVEQGGSVSLLAARDFDAPSRASLSEDGNGNPVLNLSADFDRAWSGVGRSLELADIRVDDLNRSLGVYYINLAEGAQRRDEKPGFFRRLFGSEPSKEEIEARAERYQVRLTTVGEGVQVTVEKDLNTIAPDDVARRVLGLIQDNLG
ncbi:outer membrane protein assembly factor BamC [Pseudomonas sp. NCHU5208]|uniref:outer membrane protein assembly factor BamC n=1 Tax=unclassified Pseudomonas TaxID=196821 RepID=UPI0023F8AA28|nr:outer membrane protein assembly factor BamC [Pseudomonas sp. AA-38]